MTSFSGATLATAVSVFALCGSHALAQPTAQDAQEQQGDKINFDIPAGPLAPALVTLSRQSNDVVMWDPEVLRDKQAKAVQGEFTLPEALGLMLNSSGLKFRRSNEDPNAYLITAQLNGRNESTIPTAEHQADALEQSEKAGSNSLSISTDAGSSNSSRAQASRRRDVIIVTGTNIRGVSNVPSPITVIDRADIDRTGFATTDQLIGSLTQNLDTSVNTANSLAGTGDRFGGAAVNLRGLGRNSTLTLLNGRRLANSGGSGDFVDISLIPLSAVDRIEVLSDGASAIYGSDAIGGVVNFILRDDFDGAETSFRFGGVTEGSSQEYQASQLFGKSWSDGNILASYEYYRRNSLDSNSRDVSIDADDPTDLVPQQERHSLFVSGRQEVSPRFELFADGFFSTRDTENDRTVSGTNSNSANTNQQIGVSLGANIALSPTWQTTISGTYNHNEVDDTITTGGSNDVQQLIEQTNDLWAIDVLADGRLFELPGGAVKLALGAQFRSEEFDALTQFPLFPTVPDSAVVLDRDVYSVSSELFIPLIGDDNAMPGARSLELTFAGRFDDYSDFGSTVNPKIGLSWSPFLDLRMRGTFGTSFRAPALFQLGVAQANTVVPGFFYTPAPGATTTPPAAILVSGGNPDLDAEEAESLSLGFDYKPSYLPDLKLSLTYYEIDFDSRIATPFSTTETFGAFANPAAFGEFFVFPASQADIDSLFASPATQNPFGVDLADVEAIFLNNFQNAESTSVSGLDFNLAYSSEFSFGSLLVDLSGSYIIDFTTQQTPVSVEVELLDTVNRPVDFRFRGGFGWSNDGLNATLYLNYVDGYAADIPEPSTPIESWTTLDASLSYVIGSDAKDGLLGGVRVALNTLNVLNEEPPFVQNARGFGVNFDGNNANALGRSVFIQVTKTW